MVHFMLASPWPLSLAFAAAAYFVSFVVYRLFLHPLARYPGPLLAKLTDLHHTYHAAHGDRHLEFYRNHVKYGPVVRFGPNSLSFNSSSALHGIYSHKANVRKAKFYEAFWANKDATSTHSTIDKSVHARKRRVLSHAFSDAAMKSMEKYVLAHVRQFCSNMATGGSISAHDASLDQKTDGFGPTVNVAHQANYLAFDIMGDLCFGKAFGMLDRPDNRFATDLVANASHRHLICGTFAPLHTYHLDKMLFRKIAAGRTRYMQYSKAQAAERTKLGQDSERKDFFYYLLKAKDPETGKGFSTPELWGESNLLIIAGSDTTSTAVAAAIFYLTHNPHVLQKLFEEISGAFSDVEDITMGSRLSGLSYLRACIDEAMRMSPSVGGLLPREVLAGGMEIDGHHIPPGTVVGVPHYAIHHNENYYPEPFTFKPERWISNPSDSFEAQNLEAAQAAFCPFSVGPRGCIGKGMAYAELTLTLARLVFTYDMQLASNSTLGAGHPGLEKGRLRANEYQLYDTFTSLKDGPLVQFKSRGSRS